MPTISSISGLRLMRPPPCLAVPNMDADTETLSARAETNAVSRMTIANAIASASITTPPATIGSRRSMTASPTAAPISSRAASAALQGGAAAC